MFTMELCVDMLKEMTPESIQYTFMFQDKFNFYGSNMVLNQLAAYPC